MTGQAATAKAASQNSGKAKAVGRARGAKAKAKAKFFPLMDVPMDVFCEIATHVTPADLLNLARTCKAFRRVLMRRSARHIWQATMKNEHLPPMPEDSTEPEWINLLFSYHCHECLKKGPHTPYWELRMRLCAACRREEECRPEVMDMHHTLADYFDYEFEEGIDKICVFELMPVLSKGNAETDMLMFGMFEYRECDFNLLKRTLRRASVKERTEIVLARRATMKARREHASRYMRDWDIKQRHARSYDKYQVQLSRRKAIVAKLRELGYGPELDAMSSVEREEFGKMREVAQFRPLTDRIWSSIKDACVEFMEDVRSSHEAEGPGRGAVSGWDGSDVIDYDFWRTMVRSSFDPISDDEL